MSLLLPLPRHPITPFYCGHSGKSRLRPPTFRLHYSTEFSLLFYTKLSALFLIGFSSNLILQILSFGVVGARKVEKFLFVWLAYLGTTEPL
jgi:hypothetical protein